MLENPNIDLGVVGTPAGAVDANVLFWGGFGIFSGTEHPRSGWRFLKFYAGEEGAEVWQDWALPAVASVAESAGLADDPHRRRLAGRAGSAGAPCLCLHALLGRRPPIRPCAACWRR